MRGATEKLAFREYFQRKNNCLTFIGMYQSHDARKCSAPFCFWFVKADIREKKLTVIHQNSKHRYLKIIPNN